MHLPRIKSASLLTQPQQCGTTRRAADPARVTLPRHTPSPCSISLPTPAQLRARCSPIPMQMALALPVSHRPATDPISIRAHARALTASFDNAPDELDTDPERYHSALSGHLRAWKVLFARVLQGVVHDPKIEGLGPWLMEMCNVRIKSPETQRPHAENLVRRLFEPIVALYLSRETDPSCSVDVGCDQAKQALPDGRRARSSDIKVVNRTTRAVRNIEVTSIAAPVRCVHDLERAIQHVVDKVQGSGKGTHEGAIAINWADPCLPEEVLGDMLHLLNAPDDTSPRDAHGGTLPWDDASPWGDAACNLDRLVLMRYAADHPDPMAIFTKEDGTWYATNGPFQRFDDILPPPTAARAAPSPESAALAQALTLASYGQAAAGGV